MAGPRRMLRALCGAPMATLGQRWRAACLAAAVLLGAGAPLQAGAFLSAPVEQDSVALAELPVQARTTYKRILEGGPFPYDKDGTVFGNRERLLPKEKRGYYREYTVKTPRERSRGARRIVCGGWQPTRPDACYYTHGLFCCLERFLS